MQTALVSIVVSYEINVVGAAAVDVESVYFVIMKVVVIVYAKYDVVGSKNLMLMMMLMVM